MTETERQQRQIAYLRSALEKIMLRAYYETPCESLEDARKDLRNIHATANLALGYFETVGIEQ